MVKQSITLVVILAFQCVNFLEAVCPQALTQQFNSFLEEYNLTFPDPAEYAKRIKIFSDNLNLVDSINSDPSNTFQLTLNEFATLTAEEFKASYTGSIVDDTVSTIPGDNLTSRKKRQTFQQATYASAVAGLQNIFAYNQSSWSSLPVSVNWTAQGYVAPVQNQGSCGSCWAFSAVAALEGQVFKTTGKLIKLSEQNLVDCVYKTTGCNGGRYYEAWTYINKNDGIETGESYSYISGTGKDTGICKYNTTNNAKPNLARYTKVSQNPTLNEAILKEAVAKVGPISISIDSTPLQFYKSGVVYNPTQFICATADHAVLLVGYGTDPVGGDYWLIKNSWGTRWGEYGYYRLARNRNNYCKPGGFAYYPNVQATTTTTTTTTSAAGVVNKGK